MSTYIIPVADSSEVFVLSVTARNEAEARVQFIRKMEHIYDLDVCSDLEDLENICNNKGIYFGEFSDIEAF